MTLNRSLGGWHGWWTQRKFQNRLARKACRVASGIRSQASRNWSDPRKHGPSQPVSAHGVLGDHPALCTPSAQACIQRHRPRWKEHPPSQWPGPASQRLKQTTTRKIASIIERVVRFDKDIFKIHPGLNGDLVPEDAACELGGEAFIWRALVRQPTGYERWDLQIKRLQHDWCSAAQTLFAPHHPHYRS